MTHTLRKYLSNRGSALFMVLSTMTALLIAVMAMYFSIVSSRTVQYTVFNQEQSYQSAISLQNAMTADLTDSGPLYPLLQKITEDSFAVGNSISTNGNGFAAFGGTNEEQDNVGAYDVTITRLPDEVVGSETCKTYDIATTVSVNGVMETTHVFIHVAPAGDNPAVASSDIFASTGYVPNNSYIGYGYYYTQSVYDNEFTVVGTGSGGGFTMDDLACGGCLEVNKVVSLSSGRSATWVIRDRLFKNDNEGFTLGTGATDRGTLYVGRDFYINNGGTINNTDIYVLGDLHIKNSPSYSNVTFYVQGNVIVDDVGSIWSIPSNTIAYVGGDLINSMNGFTWDGHTFNAGQAVKYKDESDVEHKYYTSWTDTDKAIAKLIDDKTRDHDFDLWEVPASKWNGHKVEIQFNSSNTAAANDPYYELEWTDVAKEQYADITDVVDLGDASYTNYTVVIDTGDDPENIFYLRLNANRPLTGWSGGQVISADNPDVAFSWMPTRVVGSGSSKIRKQVAGKVNVIYKGEGSVVCFIPDGVVMVASDRETVMHEGWFDVAGGTRSGYLNHTYEITESLNPTLITPHIHQQCGEGSCNCDYQAKVLTTTKCPICGEAMTELTCEKHSYKKVFCTKETCDYYVKYSPKKVGGVYKGLCNNRIDKTTFSAGQTIPNVNFFLVSCDESAEIYISTISNGDGTSSTIMQNKYFGFIYAPYMTYCGTGSSGGNDKLRFCGGMVVSDYILNDDYCYINCYPTHMPEELGADQGTLAHADKSWKVSIARN